MGMLRGASVLRRSVFFVAACTSLAAPVQAQTCVGTTDIVCTNTGAAGVIENPPSGPVTGSTNLTNINTATGTAVGIRTATITGNAASTNYGVVSDGVSAIVFGAPDFSSSSATATVRNYGMISGNLGATAVLGSDATVYNDGVARILSATVVSSAFGSARVFNSGQALTISARGATTVFGETLVVNSGTLSGNILSRNFASNATSINSGTALDIITISNTGGLARTVATTVNSGTVNRDIRTDGPDINFAGGAAITVNSGYVAGKITTSIGINGSAETTNEATGVAHNITTTAGQFSTATTTNFGRADNLVSLADDRTARVFNYGIAGATVSASSNAGSAAVFNSGSIAGSGPVIVSASSTNGPVSVFNSGSIGGTGNMTVSASSSGGSASIVNSGSIGGSGPAIVSAASDSGPASVVNSGTIRGTLTVSSAYNGAAGPGSFLTNSGLIDGTGQYAAIDFLANAPDARMTLNLLPGSRVLGPILLAGDASDPDAAITTVNIQGSGRGASSILTFGDRDGYAGLSAARVNVTDAIYVISGNSIAIVDPSSFAVASRNIVDVTHAISSLVTGRLGNEAPASSEGQAIGFAPSGNIARDMANDAFASIPGMAYAGQDRVLAGNPNFTAVDGTSVWAQGFGGRRTAPEDGPVLRSINSFFGGALGVDKAVQPKLRLGAFVGGGNVQSDLDANAGRTVSDIGFAGLYGRYSLNSGFVDFSLLGGGGGNVTSRKVDNNLVAGGTEYARGNYASWFVSPELAYGIMLPLGSATTLTPTLRLRYLAAGFGGYQESGSDANLTIADRMAHYVEERSGVALTHTLAGFLHGRLQLTGTAGVSALQRAGDSDVNALLLGQSLAFATPGRANVTGFYAGAGFDWRHASGASLFAATEYNTMSDASRTITARGGLKVAF